MKQDLQHQGTLTRAGYPGHTSKETQWNLRRDILEIVLLGADHGEISLRFPLSSRDSHGLKPPQILTGQRSGVRHHLFRRTLRDHLPTLRTGPRSHVENVVRRHHGLRVVFDDEYGIAKIT